jgi:hypothetical protein
MLTIEDCIALSELTPEEIAAIAEEEHLPQIVAAELGCYLVHTAEGRKRIKAMIRDDIETAHAHGDFRHAAKLKLVLKHFIAEHAEAPCGITKILMETCNEPG